MRGSVRAHACIECGEPHHGEGDFCGAPCAAAFGEACRQLRDEFRRCVAAKGKLLEQAYPYSPDRAAIEAIDREIEKIEARQRALLDRVSGHHGERPAALSEISSAPAGDSFINVMNRKVS